MGNSVGTPPISRGGGMKKLLFLFGTRPEAIKMAPLILEAQRRDEWDVRICLTGQHREMVNPVMEFFQIKAHWDLNLMEPAQSLFRLTSRLMEGLEKVLEEDKPDFILVQGDTTTAFLGALAAFYKKIPLGHVEGGLRSFRKDSPFPEEINRRLISPMADFHFAPTAQARENLLKEGIPGEGIFVVGNPVIDALLQALEIWKGRGNPTPPPLEFLSVGKKVLLVTGHRRESFGEAFQNICRALREIAFQKRDLEIVYPVHLNPQVQKPVYEMLSSIENVHLVAPLDYPHMVWLMERSHLILTDSGGIQEEAPSLGKPVLVMREVTERTEGLKSGTCRLVGTDQEPLVRETLRLLDNPEAYHQMARSVNPYGDGKTSPRILEIIHRYCFKEEFPVKENSS